MTTPSDALSGDRAIGEDSLRRLAEVAHEHSPNSLPGYYGRLALKVLELPTA